jgi:hypothetical protein
MPSIIVLLFFSIFFEACPYVAFIYSNISPHLNVLGSLTLFHYNFVLSIISRCYVGDLLMSPSQTYNLGI